MCLEGNAPREVCELTMGHMHRKAKMKNMPVDGEAGNCSRIEMHCRNPFTFHHAIAIEADISKQEILHLEMKHG